MYDTFYFDKDLDRAKQQAIMESQTEYAWVLYKGVDYSNFDLRFVPSKFKKSYAHTWGSHNNQNSHTTWLLPIEQIRKNQSVEIEQHDIVLPAKNILGWQWITDKRIDYTNFNFNWLPDEWDWDKNHAFTMKGTTKLSYTFLQKEGAVETVYHPAELEFMSDIVDDEWVWETDSRIDYTNFDFTWLPDAWDIDKVHCFCMQGLEQLNYTRLYNSKHKQTESKFHATNLKFKPNAAADEWVWETDSRIDYTNFDFIWLPDAWDINKEHCFVMQGTTQLSYTRLYNAKATIVETKYHKSSLTFKPNAAADEWVWETDSRIDYTNFDFTWLPDAFDLDKDHYFCMDGCEQLSYTRLYNTKHERTESKYHKSNLRFLPGSATDEWVWETDSRIDYSNFDFNWLPNEWDKDKVHYFCMRGCKQLSYTRLINLKHKSKGNKYHSADLMFKPGAAADEWVWETDSRIDYTNFDFTWLPDEWDMNKDHLFCMNGLTQLSYTRLYNKKKERVSKKFHKSTLKFKPKAAAEEWIWETDSRIDYTNFDFTWLPDAFDCDKVHEFCMRGKEQLSYTRLYNAKCKQIESKFHSADLDFIPGAAKDEWVWETDSRIDYSKFDFTWLPDAWDRDKDHYFCMRGLEQLSYTRLYNSKFKQTTAKFHMSTLEFNPGAANDEWVWEKDERIDYTGFDFTWLPDAWEKEYAHCFCIQGKEQLSYTKLINIKHNVQGKNKFYESNLQFIDKTSKFTREEIEHIRDLPEWIWEIDRRIDYTNFNFDWLPDAWEKEYSHWFCMQDKEQLSYTRLINTKHNEKDKNKFYAADLKFTQPTTIIEWPNFAEAMLTGDDWFDCLVNWVVQQNIQQEWVWVVDSRIDYTKFDFNWLPDRDGLPYIHCFSMQGHEKLSYTWLVNTNSLRDRQYKFIKSNLKFLKPHADTVVLDMGFNNNNFVHYQKKLRFTGTMEAMLSSAVKRATNEWLHVISTCCDYMMFDFTWLPDLDQVEYTQCWPSNDQEKGDTFLIHIPTYLRTGKFEFNFDHESVLRVPWPPFVYNEDSLAEALNNHPRMSSLYVAYYKQNSVINRFPSPCLWDKRPVVGLNLCNSVSLVPRDCVVKEEIYEYPYLKRHANMARNSELDVVFIHNGEKDSGVNLTRCNLTMPSNMNLRISSGVNGRLKAYQTAAELSSTDWFLAVFAKCHMTESFRSFSWRPDYWQKPKHYIFHNHNVDLDLTYGHMAPIAYNKKLMLENKGGLDMTLAQEHAVIPIVLSETQLTDPWDTWRTAFRETVKLLYYSKTDDSIELKYRLHKWLNAEEQWSKHNPWYQYGSKDAKDFFDSVDGDWGWIMVTNEWDWLRKRFNALYPTQQT